MPEITMRDLLEAGVHFGHHARRWNPKMAPFIFREKNGIHIIDLRQTVERLQLAFNFVEQLVRHGDTILFVGTKKSAQDAVASEATRCGMPYVNARWMGGMLTNFRTVESRLRRMHELEQMQQNGEMDALPKRETLVLLDDLRRMERNLGGMRDLRRVPSAIFVVDTRKEHLAMAEAHRLEVPIIGLVDTNVDPDEVDYPIPANDDGIRSVQLICHYIADAVLDARMQMESAGSRAVAEPAPTAEPEEAEEVASV
jgi:small subunit ribosomal protein S2